MSTQPWLAPALNDAYHTTGANGDKVYLAGDYSWNHRESGNFGIVYEVYAVG